MKNKKMKLWKKILIVIVALLLICVGAFLIYANDYYLAEDVAVSQYETLKEEGYVREISNYVIFTPEESNDIGIVFYPGAKVEEIAYTPLLNKLREQGFTCLMFRMPFHMAIFNSNAADVIFEEDFGIETWYMCGHSMGGAMASNYTSANMEELEGLILLGAYIYCEVSPQDALTVYGTFNSNLEEDIDYEDNIVVIDGGNHAQFGNYGRQKGDPDATITADEQQEITVEAIVDFISNRK
jgi:hypothetical protein